MPIRIKEGPQKGTYSRKRWEDIKTKLRTEGKEMPEIEDIPSDTEEVTSTNNNNEAMVKWSTFTSEKKLELWNKWNPECVNGVTCENHNPRGAKTERPVDIWVEDNKEKFMQQLLANAADMAEEEEFISVKGNNESDKDENKMTEFVYTQIDEHTMMGIREDIPVTPEESVETPNLEIEIESVATSIKSPVITEPVEAQEDSGSVYTPSETESTSYTVSSSSTKSYKSSFTQTSSKDCNCDKVLKLLEKLVLKQKGKTYINCHKLYLIDK